jgi:putative phage-type endonuclease
MEIQQNTPEWLEMRRSKIGASDSPIILGVSRFKTPFELWEEKVLGKETESTWAMDEGHRKEESARAAFEKKTGISTMPKVVLHAKHDWMMASLDGITFDGKAILELKCPSKEVHELAKKGVIPEDYAIQLQHQLECTPAADKAYYCTFHSDETAIVEVTRDAKVIKKILKEGEKFYNLMLTKEAPELSDKDYVLREDKKWAELVAEYKEVKAELDILKQCEEGLRDKLIEAADKRNSQGLGLRLTRSVAKGQVDYKLVPELIGVDLEAYRKPSCEKWRITLKEET